MKQPSAAWGTRQGRPALCAVQGEGAEEWKEVVVAHRRDPDWNDGREAGQSHRSIAGGCTANGGGTPPCFGFALQPEADSRTSWAT